jgi:hypothetical protein
MVGGFGDAPDIDVEPNNENATAKLRNNFESGR